MCSSGAECSEKREKLSLVFTVTMRTSSSQAKLERVTLTASEIHPRKPSACTSKKAGPWLINLGVFFVTHKREGITTLYTKWQKKVYPIILKQSCSKHGAWVNPVFKGLLQKNYWVYSGSLVGTAFIFYPVGNNEIRNETKVIVVIFPELLFTRSRAEWVLTKMIELGIACLSALLVTDRNVWHVKNTFLILFL